MDISRFIPFTKKSEKEEVTEKRAFLFSLREKSPQISFALSVFIAAFGILFLLMFPYLLITVPFNLYDTVIHAKELKDWIDAGIQLLLIIIGGGFSWAIYKLKFTLPTGLDVSEEKFPHLYKLIEELRDEFGKPKIDRIIIRDKYEIHVVKTPQNGLPFLHKTTLIIGLPVFLTMSPLYFRALLARRVGQLSTKHTPITTRLYFLTDIWLQFSSSAKHSKNIFTKILSYYFKVYTRIYQAILMPLLQDEELEADSYGMDIVHESDMAECMVYEEVVTTFLKSKFWPKIYHMARRSKTPEFMPYSQMTKVVKAGITDEEISTTVQASLKAGMETSTREPSLSNRLNHLGRAKPIPPKRLTKTAAEYYFGSSLVKIIQMFDKRWLAKLQKKVAK